MNALFIHQNYPAQLGLLAQILNRQFGWKSTYVTKWEGQTDTIPMIKYALEGIANEKVHFLARNFENASRSALGVYKAVRNAGLKQAPDLIVSHCGFGSTALLADLFQCPVVSLFEFFYRPHTGGPGFRKEFPMEEEYQRRLRVLNSMILLDLDSSAAGYTPTQFQRNQFPREYLPKIQTLFDGVDHRVFTPKAEPSRTVCGRTIPPGTKVVTYVSRGFESTRGYDIFVKVAKRVYQEYPDVLFVCPGSDRVCYGGDLRHIKEKSFREHVEKKEQPDPSKFFYPGVIPTGELANLLALSDAHVYFTVPFVLSWSMFNAMSSGCRIVSCTTDPITEVVVDQQSALLADFYDVEAHAQNVLRLLREPGDYAHLGTRARKTVEQRYSLDRTVPDFLRLFARVTGRTYDEVRGRSGQPGLAKAETRPKSSLSNT